MVGSSHDGHRFLQALPPFPAPTHTLRGLASLAAHLQIHEVPCRSRAHTHDRMHTPLSVIKSSWLSHFLSHNRRFGCDFRFMKDKTNGILDCAVNLQPFWQDTPLLDKADRLVYRQTKMTHAMVTHFLVKTKSLSFWLSAANFPLFCFCPLY